MSAFAAVLALLATVAFAQDTRPPGRVALVIGNGAYKDAPLPNALNDAADMAGALQASGFTVIRRDNRDPDVLGEDELAAVARAGTARSYPARTVIVERGRPVRRALRDPRGALPGLRERREPGARPSCPTWAPASTSARWPWTRGPARPPSSRSSPRSSSSFPPSGSAPSSRITPDFAVHFIRKLLHRIRELTHNVSGLALLDAYGRVARLLLEAAREEDGRQVVAERMTQAEIASRVGCSREMVSRDLQGPRAGRLRLGREGAHRDPAPAAGAGLSPESPDQSSLGSFASSCA